MHASAFASYLASYAHKMAAPVIIRRRGDRSRADCRWLSRLDECLQLRARAVVIATGACDTPFRPPMANALASSIMQINPAHYREPEQLPKGGVLVVGASSTGVQLAEEIHASGRPVVLAVGDHTRVPRRYRGRDMYARMEMAGILDDPADEGGNLDAARRQPSLQLVGRPDNRDLDLGILSRQGIRLVGRFAAAEGAKVEFSGDLERTTTASHVRMLRMLDRIDDSIKNHGLEDVAADPAVRVPFLAASDAAHARFAARGHPIGGLGHRLCPSLSMAQSACSRRPR